MAEITNEERQEIEAMINGLLERARKDSRIQKNRPRNNRQNS